LTPEAQQAVLLAGHEATVAQRAAMEVATLEALAILHERGDLEFIEVDRSLFQARVLEVYRNNAVRVGGMEVIDEIVGY